MDTFDRKTRSWIMQQVKGRNTNPEKNLLRAVKSAKIKGWRRNYSKVIGNPDLAFPRQKVAIFIDGCFWHGCEECDRKPGSNKDYWNKKIARNKTRDQEVNIALRKKGWKVMRVWEHDIKGALVSKVAKQLADVI